ncbi:hypothetical protein [Rhodoblastus acidophilus]|nr:hypothetical protein [Rhodoblastus acidophilus]
MNLQPRTLEGANAELRRDEKSGGHQSLFTAMLDGGRVAYVGLKAFDA